MFSTLITFIFIDPYVSSMTDDIVKNNFNFKNYTLKIRLKKLECKKAQ